MRQAETGTVREMAEFVVSLSDQHIPPKKLLATLTTSGDEVFAHLLNGDDRGLSLLLVTSDSLHTELILRYLGLEHTIDQVVVAKLPQQVGSAALLGMRLREAGVDIHHSYISLSKPGVLCAVFKTNDNQRAVMIGVN